MEKKFHIYNQAKNLIILENQYMAFSLRKSFKHLVNSL